jgi:hypothetical protein
VYLTVICIKGFYVVGLKGEKEEPMPDAAGPAGEDVKMEDAPAGDAADAPPTSNGGEAAAEGGGDGATPMETDAKEAPKEETELVKKKRVKKLPISFQANVGGLDQKIVQVGIWTL